MRLLQLSTLALAAETAYGYLDTSPLFIFSTSQLLEPLTRIQTASSLTSSMSWTLSQCPSDFYILVSQPGVSHADYASKATTPGLARHLSSQNPSSHIRSSISIPDVFGEIDISSWQSVLASKCKAHLTSLDGATGAIPTTFVPTPHAISISFPPPAPSSRMEDLAQNDLYLSSLLDILPSSNYTVLYTTSTTSMSTIHPSTEREYSMDPTLVEQALHLDLKRDLSTHTFAKRENITLPEGGLFERYQFFTPGIFMGLVVGFILLMILYVGISGLASLQVSYAAFDKEQGQLASKKTQ